MNKRHKIHTRLCQLISESRKDNFHGEYILTPKSRRTWDRGTDCRGVITLWCDAETGRSQLLFPGTVTLKGDRLMELTFQLYLPIMHIWRGRVHCVWGCIWRCVYECFIWREVGRRTTEYVSAICGSVRGCLHAYNSASVCVCLCMFVCVWVWRKRQAYLCVYLMPVGSSSIIRTTMRWGRRERARWRRESVSPLTSGPLADG